MKDAFNSDNYITRLDAAKTSDDVKGVFADLAKSPNAGKIVDAVEKDFVANVSAKLNIKDNVDVIEIFLVLDRLERDPAYKKFVDNNPESFKKLSDSLEFFVSAATKIADIAECISDIKGAQAAPMVQAMALESKQDRASFSTAGKRVGVLKDVLGRWGGVDLQKNAETVSVAKSDLMISEAMIQHTKTEMQKFENMPVILELAEKLSPRNKKQMAEGMAKVFEGFDEGVSKAEREIFTAAFAMLDMIDKLPPFVRKAYMAQIEWENPEVKEMSTMFDGLARAALFIHETMGEASSKTVKTMIDAFANMSDEDWNDPFKRTVATMRVVMNAAPAGEKKPEPPKPNPFRGRGPGPKT